MKTSHAILGLIAAAAVAVPAFAAANHIASIPLTNRTDHTMTFAAFKGPVNTLQLSAEAGDVRCVSVTVTFANGRMEKVFSGNLEAKSTKDIAFSGERQNLSEITFECKATDASAGSIGLTVMNG